MAVVLFANAANAQRTRAQLNALAKSRLSQIDGELRVAGLDSAVDVRRDRWGVPHIYARTQHDLFFAQGLVAAQDRLFQMEMWRRIGEGRLAEVLGPSFVERDKVARLLKYRGDMNAEWASYAPDTRSIATAFADGVNAWIDHVRDKPPVEFTLLGFAPTRWTPEVILQRMAALSMTVNADNEITRAELVAAVGPQVAARLWPTIPHRDLDPAPGLPLAGITSKSLGAFGAATGSVRYPRLEGSNNWVVAGSKTASGKPLLANDPHRFLDNPSLRYITHLVGPGWNVIGGGEPGLPGVAAGHNERIAFGFTIVGMDQQDVYVETIGPCPSAPARRCYLGNGAWKPLRVIIDTLAVKGDAPNIVRLEFTEHGPLMKVDAAGADGRARGFALRFVGSEPGTAGYLAQLSINRARDWPTFQAAAARWKLPTENLVYADVDGNIGWIAAGLMPKRSWSGLLPVPGTGGFEWSGFVAPSDLPQAFNPSSGFIATANNDIRPAGYDTPLNYEFEVDYRARRIAHVLGEGGAKLTASDMTALQHDDLAIAADVLLPILDAAAARMGASNHWVVRELGSWDKHMRMDARAPLLFQAWKQRLGDLALARVAPKGVASLLSSTWLDDWNDPAEPLRQLEPAVRDSLAVAAVDSAVARLKRDAGADSSAWRWGALHVAAFPHHVAAAFDLAPVPRNGYANTVNSTYGAGYRQQYGASYREVIDVADWDRSLATSVPGQSGQPGSEHYGDLLPLWAKGEYFPMVYSRAAVRRETKHMLSLKPRDAGGTR